MPQANIKRVWNGDPTASPVTNHRLTERQLVNLPARLTWKDQHGTARFATVVTRDVSDCGVFVECQSAVSIPLYRLVQFQLEREVRESDALPATLRHGRILSAVYRVSPATKSGSRQGLALRLMVEPKRATTSAVAVRAFADIAPAHAS